MGRVSTWLTRPVRRWLETAEERETMRRCGGDQRCPWCRRWMNQSLETFICPFDYATDSSALDEFVCGHCGGTSLWKWEIGFIFVMRGDTPPAPPCGFNDCEFIRRVIAEAETDLADRGRFVDRVFPAENSAPLAAAEQRASASPAPDEQNPTPTKPK